MQKETYVAPELQKQEPLHDITAWGPREDYAVKECSADWQACDTSD